MNSSINLEKEEKTSEKQTTLDNLSNNFEKLKKIIFYNLKSKFNIFSYNSKNIEEKKLEKAFIELLNTNKDIKEISLNDFLKQLEISRKKLKEVGIIEQIKEFKASDFYKKEENKSDEDIDNKIQIISDDENIKTLQGISEYIESEISKYKSIVKSEEKKLIDFTTKERLKLVEKVDEIAKLKIVEKNYEMSDKEDIKNLLNENEKLEIKEKINKLLSKFDEKIDKEISKIEQRIKNVLKNCEKKINDETIKSKELFKNDLIFSVIFKIEKTLEEINKKNKKI